MYKFFKVVDGLRDITLSVGIGVISYYIMDSAMRTANDDSASSEEMKLTISCGIAFAFGVYSLVRSTVAFNDALNKNDDIRVTVETPLLDPSN